MTAPFQPGTASQPVILVELTISCRNLIKMDVLSKSDPMCVTYIKNSINTDWQEFHRTECIQDCHDPDFITKAKITYRFEEQQQLKFKIIDVDSTSKNIDDHDLLGEAECTLGKIVSAGHAKIPLKGTSYDISPRGYVLIAAEEASDTLDEITLQFSGQNLDSKGWFGRTDPCLIFSKSTEGGQYSVTYKSEVIRWNRSPSWKRFTVSVASFCGNDWNRSVKVACCHKGNTDKHNLIGECYVTLNDLAKGPAELGNLVLINPEKQKKDRLYKSSGTLKIQLYSFKRNYSFLDYIRGGTDINCSIGIDFTGSNGNPMESLSLHYITNSYPNEYEQAIISVGGIIQDYDSDKKFPVLGFGAKIPPTGQVSHEFFVNLSNTDPYCEGINGVLQAYRTCIRRVQLYGPTNFAPIINHVAKFAAAYKNGSHYFILLILTDGAITDLQQTTQAIIQASTLPLSIIIVGIGMADFTAMDFLDSDDRLLSYNGKVAARDIVQFVPFRKFKTPGSKSINLATARSHLAREVLAEIPRQFLTYMRANNVIPKPQIASEAVFLPPDPDIVLTNV